MTDLGRTVAVTRNGRGDMFVFDSYEDAFLHPLVQFGDAILVGPEDIRSQFNKPTLNQLLERLGEDELRVSMMSAATDARSHRELEEVYTTFRDRVWLRMHITASEPPDDPIEVLDMIRINRIRYNDGLPKERTMADKETTTEAKTPKAPKYDPDAKITMLADKDGKAYGTDNNPKRAGSASAERFAHYGNGTTVNDFLAAGGKTADIDNDVKKNFIKVG